MATKIYDDPWSPSNINCNWKPEKLSRYSFVTNMIDFNDPGCQEGYGQSGIAPREDDEMNLTAYIEVSPNTYYYFRCENGVTRGIRFICFFTSNSGSSFISDEKTPNSTASLKGFFKTPSNCHYIRITMYKQAWKKCTLRPRVSTMTGEKDMTPLNIVDNKTGEKIYEDLHFEVYVKAEALIKNFVDCFSLRAFQSFPNDETSYWYGSQNSILFSVNTMPFYLENYSYVDFVGEHSYSVGDRVKGVYIGTYVNITYYLVCLTAHTSAATFNDEWINNSNLWQYINNFSYWLQISKNIKESNYNPNIGFPYVGSLLFKDLWGCDMTNYLKTYTKKSYLTLYYHPFFAEKLRQAQTNYYDKFFNEGYFAYAGDYSNVEGFGLRLIRGENFRNDEILGDLIANNYLNFEEIKHNIPENWDYSTDNVNINCFNNSLSKPFDHYYSITPKGYPNTSAIPFFKEKSFEDFKIEVVLERKDILGNIFQRIIDLPIFVNFYNNLIKVYFRNNHNNFIGQFYQSEYLPSSSNYEIQYIAPTASGDSGKTDCRFTVWCPNIERLSLSSTIIGPLQSQKPEFTYHNGQLGVVKWTFDRGIGDIGKVMKAIHILEYSDGANYDKFIYMESITVTAA